MPELSGKLSLDGTQYNKTMSDAEKENAKFQRQVNQANKELNAFSRNASSAKSSLAGLAQSFKSGDIGGFITNARGAATAITSLIPAGASAGTALTSLGAAATTALGPVGLIAGAIAGIAGISIASIGAVEDFDKSMRSLSALTGVTGKALDEMGDNAIEMSDKYGIAATEIVGSMEKIGSQAPVLLQDKKAMAEVTEAAIVLQKAAGNISMDESSAAITTVMNQMGVEASEATNIINALAAGSQKGSADINYLNQSIAKCGAQAAGSKMSYQQLVGAIETIGPKFASAEVAGTALNSMLIRLQTQGESKFNPAVVGMEKALDNLAAANLNAEQKVKLFGQAGLLAANTLIEQRKDYKEMTEAVTGTNTAYDQMNARSGGLATTFDKLKNSWNNFMIVIGQSAPIQTVIGLISLMGKGLTGLIQVCEKIVGAFNTTVEVIVAVFKKMWEYVKPQWDNLVGAITNSSIYQACARIFKAIYEFIIGVINKISNAWHAFLNWLGIESKKPETKVVDLKVNDSELKKIDEAVGSKSGKKSKTIDFDKGSLEFYKQELSKLEDKLTKKKLSLVDVEKTKQSISDLKKQIEEKEIELGLRAKPGSLENIESQISEIDSKLKKLDPKIDSATIMKLQVDKEALLEAKKNVTNAVNGVVINGSEFTTNGASGSLQEAGDRVAYYKQRIQVETEGTEQYYELADNIREWTEKEHNLRVKMDLDTSGIPENTQEWFDKRIQIIQAEIKAIPTDTKKYDEKVKELKELKAKEQVINAKIALDTNLGKDGSLSKIQAEINNIKGQIDLEVYGSDDYWKLKKDLKELEDKEHEIKVKMNLDDMSALDKYDTFVGMFDGIDGVVNSFTSLTQAIEEDGNAWEVFMSTISVVDSIINSVMATMQAYQLVVSLLTTTKEGAAAAEGAHAAASVTSAAATIAESAASKEEATTEAGAIAPKTAQVAANKALEASVLDLAAAQIFLAHAGIPFVGTGLASGFVSTMMAVMAAQHAASLGLQAFADGGIVNGKTTIGDMNMIRVNGGEMVLNKKQQSNLFDAIDKNKLGSNNNGRMVADVKVKGTDMYLMFKNLSKIEKSVGKDIGIR